MNIYISIFILLIILLIIIYALYLSIRIIKQDETPDVKWPFLNLKDENGQNINILCIRGHMKDDEKKQFLEYYNKGIKFVGCSSYMSYPRVIDNQHGFSHRDENIKINEKYIEDYVLGWCHCFKEPDKYIKYGIPRVLISESDFNNERLEVKDLDIKYDYIMYQPKDSDKCDVNGWHSHNKNWLLAEKAINVLSDNMNLKGIVTGRSGCSVNIINKNNIEVSDFIPFHKFMDKIRQSRFVVIPNLEDASPRLLTEALCLEKPILVNEDILGGWKYVNDRTGTFFNQNNIQEKATWLMNNYGNFTPRKFYMDNYGDVNSGKRLKAFLKKIYPDLSPCEYVKFPVS
jgi:hypothetical protein